VAAHDACIFLNGFRRQLPPQNSWQAFIITVLYFSPF